jgi:hypothetical protein
VITSTFLTLLVVPVVYTWVDRFTLKGGRKVEEKHNVTELIPPPVESDGGLAPAAVRALSQEGKA